MKANGNKVILQMGIRSYFCPIFVVDGGYGRWSEYSSCTKSCGGGTKERRRKCNNPPPEHGGKNCSRLGLTYEVVACNIKPCPGE